MPSAPYLYLNVLIIATCGLVYELLAGTLASYVLGDSVTQFSLIIGVYLSSMGVGAWLSKFITKGLCRRFVEIELAVAVLGGFSAPILFFGFAHVSWFRGLLFGLVSGIGILVGLELPLLMRILKEQLDFSDLVSRVLTFDYIGALVASLVFPLFFVPKLGLVRTSLVFGLFNAGVALWGTYLMRKVLRGSGVFLRLQSIFVICVLALGLIKSKSLTHLAEEGLYEESIVYAETSKYQRIVLTRGAGGFQLFLNGKLQFASMDEYRYHEALVHPVMASSPVKKRILILGGGDGLALREVLKYPDVEEVVLVDLDPAMTKLASDHILFRELSGDSLKDPRLTIVHDDAMVWIEESESKPFDVAIVDFPDPNNFALGKLYTRYFYQNLNKRLTPQGQMVVQSTSPLYARRSFWCIEETIKQSGFETAPYHATVPSFGVWGYVLASKASISDPTELPEGLRFLSDQSMGALFDFPSDMGPVDSQVNRLNDQVLVHVYENEWRRWQ